MIISHNNVCVGLQLYTVSQDGVLCVWESDTELDSLVLKNKPDKPKMPRKDEDEEEVEERVEEAQEGEVIRGKAQKSKSDEKTKKVQYKQISKSVNFHICSYEVSTSHIV